MEKEQLLTKPMKAGIRSGMEEEEHSGRKVPKDDHKCKKLPKGES